MVNNKKINVKERFSDGEIDLSMSDLDDVPVKEIAALKKTVSLDLSNNRLTSLPKNFTILISLTKLDLSKNEITELPEDFGSLSKLRYLDLYKNNLERLPLSFGQLNNLRFLDLKDNPLVPAIAKVAGPCIDTKGCQQCARDVVNFYRKLQEEVDNEVEMRKKARDKQLEINQQKKQSEKKNKKKVKQNAKVKQISEQEHITSTSALQKPNKKEPKKSKITQQKSQYKQLPLFKYIFVLYLLSFLTIFILTSVKLPQTQPIADFIKHYYQTFIEKLPSDYKIYGQRFSSYVRLIHEHTGNVTLSFFKYLNTNEVIQGIFSKVRQSYRVFVPSKQSTD